MADGYESRRAAFQGGSTPGGMLPPPNGTGISQQGVPPMFTPASVLQIPNRVQPVNGQSADTYMKTMLPLAAKNSPMTKAQRSDTSAGVMNV